MMMHRIGKVDEDARRHPMPRRPERAGFEGEPWLGDSIINESPPEILTIPGSKNAARFRSGVSAVRLTGLRGLSDQFPQGFLDPRIVELAQRLDRAPAVGDQRIGPGD